MDNILEKLYSLLNTELLLTCPMLSGNMLQSIKVVSVEPKKVEILIEAPFYDMKEWQKSKKIVHTGENVNGMSDYAMLVNNFGGFGTHNSSENWVNRACYNIATAIANQVGGEVINELPL